jgi:WXG100 family type VII secretion target
MADKTKVDYDALADAGNRFGQEADRIRNIAGRLGQGTENLKRSGWVGKGAEAYYKEWESSILPTYRRLAEALKEAANILKALSKLFKDAETEASNFVKGTGGGGAGGGAGEGASLGGFGEALASAFGGGSGGAASAGAAGFGSAIAGALREAFGNAFGGGGGDYGGGQGGEYGGGDGGDLESFPSTLEGLLKDALGGAGLEAKGNIIEIRIQKGQGMADTGMQYGMETPSAGGGGGGGESGGGGGGMGEPAAATAAEPQSTGGGGGGGSDSGFGGGSQARGASMVQGGAVGTPLGGGQAFWFGSTPGSRLSAPAAALSAGMGMAAPAAGGNAVGLVAQLGATAGAAVLGIAGKVILGKLGKP